MKICIFVLLVIQTLIAIRVRKKSRLRKKLMNEVNMAVNNSQLLEVHIFPHSHMDLEWLRDMDTNYNFKAKRVYMAIIDSISRQQNRTFLMSETGFIQLFMEDQSVNESYKDRLRQMVRNGQIEVVNGGYAANDEATTYYEDIIDQMTYGHQYIQNTFNKTIKTGWSIDAFGSSLVNCYIQEKMGIENIFLSRMNIQEKQQRIHDKSMQMIMDTDDLESMNYSQNYSDRSNLTIDEYINKFKRSMKKKNRMSYIQVNENVKNMENNVLLTQSSIHYGFPSGFCIDDGVCNLGWRFMDKVDDSNIEKKAQEFSVILRNASNAYQNNETLFMMLGDDFAFIKSEETYENFEKIMNHINDNRKVFNISMKYSTPVQYFDQIRQQNIENKKKYIKDVKKGDFMPYEDIDYKYWTGFYSTRPNLKHMIRKAGRFLQIIRTLFGLEVWNGDKTNAELLINTIDVLERQVAQCQHHDAITGTSKKKVNDKLKQDVDDKIKQTYQVYQKMSESRLKQAYGIGSDDVQMFNCQFGYNCTEFLNNLSEYKYGLFLNIYNPGVKTNRLIRTRIARNGIKLKNLKTNQYLQTDVFCDVSHNGQCEVYFFLKMAQYSFNQILIEYEDSDNHVNKQKFKVGQIAQIKYDREVLKVQYRNKKLGLDLEHEDMTYQFELKYKKFENDIHGFNQKNRIKGGPYVLNFLADDDTEDNDVKDFHVYQGKLITLIRLKLDDRIQIVKYYPKSKKASFEKNMFEINTLINSNENDQETYLCIRNRNLSNDGIFYTDSNGLSLMKRKTNEHDDYKPKNENLYAQNTYPITKIVLLKDEHNDSMNDFAVISDRSEGVFGLRKGEINININRSPTTDDNLGMGDGALESDKLRLSHYLVFGPDSENIARNVQYHTDQFYVQDYGQFQPNVNFDQLNVRQLQMANGFIFTGLIKMSIILDNFNKNQYFHVRFQNLQPKNNNMIIVKNVQSASQRSLNFIYDEEEMLQKQNSLEWTDKKGFQKLFNVMNNQLMIELNKNIEVKAFRLYR